MFIIKIMTLVITGIEYFTNCFEIGENYLTLSDKVVEVVKIQFNVFVYGILSSLLCSSRRNKPMWQVNVKNKSFRNSKAYFCGANL